MSQVVDPIDGLLLIAATRRAAYRAKPPRLFLGLVRGRLCRMSGLSDPLVESMLPDTLAAKEDVLEAGYDLPPSHYARKTLAADKIVACLLFEPARISEYSLRSLSADEVRGHSLSGVLLAARAFGEPLGAKLDTEELRHFIALYQSGGCHGWYLAMYVEELKKLLAIELAFKAALM